MEGEVEAPTVVDGWPKREEFVEAPEVVEG